MVAFCLAVTYLGHFQIKCLWTWILRCSLFGSSIKQFCTLMEAFSSVHRLRSDTNDKCVHGFLMWMPDRQFSQHHCFPGDASGKEPACQFRRREGHRFDPFPVRKLPWRRAWQPTPVFLPGESHEQKSLVSYSPQGRKESDKTEVT